MLSWQPCQWPYPGKGVTFKVLSQDGENGASSLILRFPRGWQAPAAAIDSDEELFVLDGSLQVGDRTLSAHGYAWLPAAFNRESMRSEEGATVLAFYAAMPAPLQEPAQPDLQASAIFRDAFSMPWSCEGMDPAYGDAGMRWKILREDAVNRDVTMLVSTPPHLTPPNLTGPQETHDCVEEAFVISGDFLSPIGTMRSGAYFWRPPGIAHGPYGSIGGNLSLIRTLGHELENNWSDDEVSLSLAPAYRPVIPAQLRQRLSDWEAPAAY
jgi:hypothetical protein